MGKQILRAGSCSRSRFMLALAIVVWVVIQMAFIPHHYESIHPLRAKSSLSLSSASSSSRRRILYVHIGKTGGEWIKSQLSVVCKTRKNPTLKKACLEQFQTTSAGTMETEISRQIIGYYHVNSLYPRNGHELASHYLYSVRNPLHRLISWYVYNHPKSCDPREGNSPSCKNNAWKKPFYECFPILETLGNKDLLFGDLQSSQCSKILWDGWKGRVSNVKDPNHLYWNYRFYWNQTQQSESRKTKPFLVVRQEHLQDDMNELEAFLRKSTTSNEGSSLTKWRRADSEHFTTGRVSRTVSQDARRNLCCALEDEFHIYNLMIAHSENLDPLAKQETSQEALRVCGVGTWEELDCPQ